MQPLELVVGQVDLLTGRRADLLEAAARVAKMLGGKCRKCRNRHLLPSESRNGNIANGGMLLPIRYARLPSLRRFFYNRRSQKTCSELELVIDGLNWLEYNLA